MSTKPGQLQSQTSVLVCLGNPPYDRQQIDPGEEGRERKGGWVRFGEGKQSEGKPILEDFLAPVREAGEGVHLKNLYNDYVYFWRWALWKVFETKAGSSGIVSFITASSYLRGPAFLGMRRVMREVFDELWIIDLEGQSGPRTTENVFAIRTAVAIAIGVRDGKPRPDVPATVHYTKIVGTRGEKLATLSATTGFRDLEWRVGYSGWETPFLPRGLGDYFDWPKLTDLFPWQHSGAQLKRTWPIGESEELLRERWRRLVSASPPTRIKLFRETRDRKVIRSYSGVAKGQAALPPLASLKPDEPPPTIVRYGFRAFDRQNLMADPRLGDFIRPDLWRVHTEHQIYLTSLLTTQIGLGPAAVASASVTDLHHFRGSYGGKDVIPLWRDADTTSANVTQSLLDKLSDCLGIRVGAMDLFAYTYGILASPAYTETFWDDLSEPGPRLPLTKNADLFFSTASMGRNLLYLHTYAERFVPEGETPGRIPRGRARSTKPIPGTAERYPEEFSYDEETKALHVGEGEIAPVDPEVWEFSVSGLEVVRSWLSYRMKKGAGKTSSPLDEIRPERWTADFTEELLKLLWILEATVEMFPALAENLDRVIKSALFEASELPTPTDEERKPPQPDEDEPVQPGLYDS